MSQVDKVDFGAVRWRSVEWTNLATLYLRACDSRSEQPILGDAAAAEAVDRIEYDWDRMRRAVVPGMNRWLVTVRAVRLDHWAADFLRRHPDAVVLHLGCGMDTRALRLDLPSEVSWFDIDQPHVVELRRTLYDDRDGYRMIGRSVTDPDWLAGIPVDRPVLVIAEGLLMYLREEQVRALFQALTDRYPAGEILFDAVSSVAPRMSRAVTKNIITWGVRDGRELEQWNPRLRLLEDAAGFDGWERVPGAPTGVAYRLLRATPLRRYEMLYRFAF